MRIFCPSCKVTYEVNSFEESPVKCLDCKTAYLQKDCHEEVSILEYLTFKE